MEEEEVNTEVVLSFRSSVDCQVHLAAVARWIVKYILLP